MKTHYTAELHNDGFTAPVECGHKHRTIKAAMRCLPKVPRGIRPPFPFLRYYIEGIIYKYCNGEKAGRFFTMEIPRGVVALMKSYNAK